MIVGAFVVKNSSVVSRFTEPLSIPKIESLVLDFMQTPKPILIKDLYKYISYIHNDMYYVLVTSLNYKQVIGQKILSYIANNSTEDSTDILVTIDNVLYNGTPIFTNLSQIKNLESQEEKIYNMMMKNKAAELKQKYNKLKSKSIESLSHSCELVKSKSTKDEFANLTSKYDNKTEETPKKIRSFETSKSDIFILLKEKMKCCVNVENTIKLAEVNGEMVLNIKNEKYKNIEITFEGDTTNCKFSPKLDKEFLKSNVIKSPRDFSQNKNIALMKWKINDIEKIPISFTFWPSEIKLGTYQVSLEFIASEDLNNLVVRIPRKKTKSVVSDLKINGDFVEWNIGNVKKNDCDTLDFQCSCNDVSDIFPIEVYFTTTNLFIGISNISVGNNNELETKQIVEVEDFKLEYE